MNPWTKVANYADKPERLLVGLMSGTSVDGVDAALVRVSGTGRETRAETVAFLEFPFPPDLRSNVLEISHGKGNAEVVSWLNMELGHLFADATLALLASAHVAYDAVDAIASHGQTVSHTGPVSHTAQNAHSETHGATLQIGEAAVIAQKVGVPVVSDFRTADIALGGQGAPLVPYADWCLLTHPTKTRCIQNIGGIGNVTYLPADANADAVLGFDTGPGNMMIDRAAQYISRGTMKYDTNGGLAKQGFRLPDERRTIVWDFLMAHPFLAQAPPKSAGREEFGEATFKEMMRLCAPFAPPISELTLYTARTITDAYQRFLPQMPDEVIIGGGGAKNPVLMKLLRELLAPIPVLTHEDVGLNSDSKEAVAFAVLANETLQGIAANLPSVTGAKRPAVLGKITLP